MDDSDQFVQQNQQEFLAIFKRLLRFQSTSGNDSQIEQTVAFLTRLLKKLFNCQIEVLSTAGSPVILCQLGSFESNNKPILFYGHYDVMAADDLDKWQTDPFELTFKDGRLYGRGAGDNKGQLLAVIFGLYMFQQLHQSFPCPIKLVIEGEEEKGSPHLNQTVQQLAGNQLQDVETVFVIDGSFNFAGQHVLRLGNRGLLGVEITLRTNDTDLHSGNFGNVAGNPVLVLHQLLGKLYDFKQQRVLIPHFYEGIEPLTPAELALLAELPSPKISGKGQRDFFNSSVSQVDYYRKLMFEPTFNVNGIQGGFFGQGIKTIIPGQVKVRIDFRLVSGQKVVKIQKSIQQLLAPWNKILTIKYLGAIPPYYAGVGSELQRQVIQGIRQIDSQAVIEPVMPGTVPNYVWQDNLAAQVFTIPLANFDQHNHAPNENISLTAFLQGIKIIYQLIKIYQV
ncbi:M20/M25/M40 family metallo-hydrolase [Liquorilactobacillus nagelii]|uniref:M20/M25/M40 family metallo-hydrolase n=1 Tax=Liquorilactobacillus nagelii TaxID=82688 RepID=UPI0006F0A422|nr:M20/M25/M40 family metallo-hydrolase [Liquorilactobacillus nagelii]KRL41127.1 peptidase M20 [Liquorilactobacillus nagelii DSM 13675]QYH54055.1 M20/M25/M40 family metallo-hydrolase [Liquorilactobacillus nagelii DSM 13675]